MKLLAIGMLLILTACKGQKNAALPNVESSDEILQLILSNEYSGADVSETLVITDQKALQSFYSKINKTRKPGLPIPKIDFEKEMIVVACSGEVNDGSLPLLELVRVTESQMVLSSVRQFTAKHPSYPITSPFSIYKMPLTDKEIIFEQVKQ